MTKARLFVNSFSGTLLFITNLVITFFLSPVIVRQLGNLNYGIWDILLSVCGYLGLLEVGIGPAIIRYIARADAFSDQKEINRILSNAFLSLSVLSIFSLFIMLLIARHPEFIFNTSVDEIPYLSLLCILAGLTMVVQFPGTVLVAYLMGLQRHSFVNFVRLILAVISGLLTYLALVKWAAAGLLWLSLILLFANLIQYFFFFFRVKQDIGQFVLGDRLISWKTTKALYLFGGKSFLIMLADRIQRLSIPFIIGHTIGVSSIVFYSIPGRLFEYALGLINVIGFPLNSFFSAIEAKSGMEMIRKTWQDTNRILQVFILGMAVNLGIFGYDFIKIWMGSPYAEGGKWVIHFLTFSLVTNGLASNSSRLLVSLDKHGGPALFLVFISFFTFGLSILLGQWWGLSGIAFSVLVGSVAGFVVCWERACSCLGLSASRAFGDTIKLAAIPIILLFSVLSVLNWVNDSMTYNRLVLNAGIGSICYLLAVFLITLRPEEREVLKAKLGDHLNYVKGKWADRSGKPW
jgi:O-antigen/teichoic acid export membrane protein